VLVYKQLAILASCPIISERNPLSSVHFLNREMPAKHDTKIVAREDDRDNAVDANGKEQLYSIEGPIYLV